MAVATATRASDRARSQRWRKAESRTHSSSQRLVAWFDRALVTRPGLAKRELAPLAVVVRELLGRELRGTLQRADRLAGKRERADVHQRDFLAPADLDLAAVTRRSRFRTCASAPARPVRSARIAAERCFE